MLKDADTLDACNVKEGDFLVVMVTKPKKAPESAPASNVPPAVSNIQSLETATTTTTETQPATATADAKASTEAATPAPNSTQSTTNPPDAPEAKNLFPEEAVTNLTSMGFPEAEVRHCLRAAHGNPDIAVEFLTNGIPENVSAAADLVRASDVASPSTPSSSNNPSTGGPLQGLRNHPQFNALRRLVQSNPGALQQVLTQIGQQQPDLLAAINANQALFLEMMNEPISENEATNSAPGANIPLGGTGMPDPQQMAQMISSLPNEQLQQMAAAMGMNPEQLRQMAASTAASGPPGENVIRLTAEEMAAVDRLTEMGFDRTEAAQAFLACDKNEALAANLLMDSMANGGGAFGNGGGAGGGGSGSPDGDDDENMYE